MDLAYDFTWSVGDRAMNGVWFYGDECGSGIGSLKQCS